MADCKCSFTATLIRQDYACQKARLVTRRAGPDISCISASASHQCKHLLTAFKQVGLPAFNATDDLLATPHSVFAKIQYGGLLGMARDIADNNRVQRVTNIFQLVQQALQCYSSVDNIPHARYVSAMTEYKRKRRKKE